MNIDDLQIPQNTAGTPPPNPSPIPGSPQFMGATNQVVNTNQAIPQQNTTAPNFSAGGVFGGNMATNTPSMPVNQPQPLPPIEKHEADKELEKNLGTLRIEAVNPAGTKKPKKVYGLFRGLTLLSILAIGILMLLNQFGILTSISYNGINFVPYFPYILILGAFILLTYRNFLAKLLGFLFFLTTLGGLISILTYHSLETQSTIDTPLTYDFAGVTDNTLSFNTLIGSYDIKGTDKLNMDLKYYGDRTLFNTTGVENNKGFLTLKEDTNWNVLQNYSSNIEAELPSLVKFGLNITNLAGYKDINLANINWDKIQLKGGWGDTILRIGTNINSDSEITIDNLVGRVVLKLPESIGIDLYYKGLYTTMEMIDMEAKDKGHYQSKNYETAIQKIKVTVNMGFGKLKVDWTTD